MLCKTIDHARRRGSARKVCAGATCALLLCASLAWLGCVGTTPSAEVRQQIRLPVPAQTAIAPTAERLSDEDRGERHLLTARLLIPLAFDRQAEIKSSYERFKSEEARYDFFYVSRDSLTPKLSVSNTFDESRANEQVSRNRDHSVELSIEKRFFDTTRMNIGVGYRSQAADQAIGDHPFVSADLRYPLWASRERLERTSEEMFRRNDLDDAQLAYIQTVRRRLERALFSYHNAMNKARETELWRSWREDLEKLLSTLDTIEDRSVSVDLRRLKAEITRVTADERNSAGWAEISLAEFKSRCGLPFHAQVELVDERFNPFAGMSHTQVLQLGLKVDPEIATLRNAVRNAEVQLNLARRGQWDVALLVNGSSSTEGRGEHEGLSDWSLSAGMEVSAVDSRVTGSLIRQAQANIARFTQSIVDRENDIYTDTLEPVIRIQTLSASEQDLITNLPRYEKDYQAGIEAYVAGRLNIDDLLTRRENVFDQQREIASLALFLGFNVAELCTATGKFFELLSQNRPDAVSQLRQGTDPESSNQDTGSENTG